MQSAMSGWLLEPSNNSACCPRTGQPSTAVCRQLSTAVYTVVHYGVYYRPSTDTYTAYAEPAATLYTKKFCSSICSAAAPEQRQPLVLNALTHWPRAEQPADLKGQGPSHTLQSLPPRCQPCPRHRIPGERGHEWRDDVLRSMHVDPPPPAPAVRGEHFAVTHLSRCAYPRCCSSLPHACSWEAEATRSAGCRPRRERWLLPCPPGCACCSVAAQ